jgi:hypothetical protein
MPFWTGYRGKLKGMNPLKKKKENMKEEKKLQSNRNLQFIKELNYMNLNLNGVHALLMQLSILEPDLFPFEMIDYNTNTGIDILVKEKNKLTIDQSRIYYVELKNILDKNFNHSFEYLHSIICWDSKILDGDEIVDISGKKRVLKIVNQDSPEDYTRYFLDDKKMIEKIVVYVLKDYLRERLKVEFRPHQSK